MQGRIDIYIKKSVKEDFEKLEVISKVNCDRNFSITIGKAVKNYIQMLQEKQIISQKGDWDILLKGKSKEELLKLNTLITELNNRVVEKLCNSQ